MSAAAVAGTVAAFGQSVLDSLGFLAGAWASTLVRACFGGGVLVLLVWAACRLCPRLPAEIRGWLWWLGALKLVLGLCCLATIPLPVLPRFVAALRPADVLPLASRVTPAAAARARVPIDAPRRRKSTPNGGDNKPPLAPAAAAAPHAPGNTTGAKRPLAAPTRTIFSTSPAAAMRNAPQQHGPVALLVIWFAGVLVIAGKGTRDYGRLREQCGLAGRRAASAATDPAAAIAADLAELATRLKLRRVPRVLVAPGNSIVTPFVAGLIRPIVVVPADFGQTLTPGEQRLALAHELAHLRSGDLWLGLVPVLARALFWFFPPAHFAAREFVIAREEAADLLALQVTGAAPAGYGRLLLALALRAGSQAAPVAVPVSAGIAAPGFVALKRRFATIQNAATPLPARTRRRLVGASVLALFAALAGLLPWRVVALAPRPQPLVAAASVAGPAQEPFPAAYVLDDIGTLGGTFSDAYAINEAGQVVGVSNPSSRVRRGRAFLWDNGRFTDLGVLDGKRRSAALGINETGTIIGASFNRYDRHHAFVWQGGAKRPLSPAASAPPPAGFRYMRALGINDTGVVVGNAQTGARDAGGALVARAVLWTGDGGRRAAVDLGTLGGRYSQAWAVNNAGQIVGKAEIARRSRTDWGGTHAFLWEPAGATMRDLGVLPGGVHSGAAAINSIGLAVGVSESAQGKRAVLWMPNTSGPRDLGTLPGDTESMAHAINNQGLIVGASQNARSGERRATLWTRDGTARDLNDLLPAGSPWHLEEARAINDRGQIVGRGRIGGIGGVRHGFVLTPQKNASAGSPLRLAALR